MTQSERNEILESLGSIKSDLANLGTDITEIKVEVKRTNGRVTRLETHEEQKKAVDVERKRVAFEKAESRAKWNGWFQPVVTGVVMIVLAALIVALLNVDKF